MLNQLAITDWIADSSASNHTTSDSGNVSLSHPPNSNMPSSIVVGNYSILSVASVGDTILPGPFYLNNILVAPNIIQNLLSIHKFTTNNSCSMKFDLFGLSVKDLAMRNVIVSSNSFGPVYTLRLLTRISTPQALTALAFASTWHHRLRHPGRDIISKLSSTTAIQCNKSHSDTLCYACQLGHDTRLPFHSLSSHTDRPFELIHCDFWTTPVLSIFGYKYYLVVLDDFTHYLWTFPLRLKSDTFTTLSNFFSYVSTQFGSTIKTIQCDNEHEFDNACTRSFLLTHGVLLRMSCSYTSPQNGKAERIICSTNNVMCSLLFQASLPAAYWVERLHIVMFLLSRLPTKTICASYPYFALFTTTPMYEHLRVFGYACYPNLSATTPHKLAPRSARYVFIDYSNRHKGYRCLDLSTNRLVIS
jgi:hypothetical protein